MEKQENEFIFLSHHSSKFELVTHLSRYLERNGLNTWYAPRNIHSGEVWDEAILNAIKKCKAVILLFCAQADSSRQVKRELALADKYKKSVFWLRVEKVEPNNLSYFLTSTQWLDWLDERDDTLDQLVRDISQLSINNSTPFIPIEDTANESTSQNKIISWTKHIFAFPSQRKAAECAARAYYEIANEKPFSTIILPTGRSATMIFRAMISVSSEYDGCPFGEAPIMSDTETFGVWSGHETSRTKHINDMLIEPLRLKGKAPSKEQLHLLSGVYTEEDPVKNARKVLRLYPPSIHAVSISPLGEILAYEVGTYSDIDDIIDDTPKIVEVGEHSKKYIDPNQPSKSILTVGIGTMMSAEILLILAFDIQKANIVRRLFEGPITAGIPATLLRKNPNSFLITTEKVAVEAGIIDYADTNINVEDAVKWITKE